MKNHLLIADKLARIIRAHLIRKRAQFIFQDKFWCTRGLYLEFDWELCLNFAFPSPHKTSLNSKITHKITLLAKSWRVLFCRSKLIIDILVKYFLNVQYQTLKSNVGHAWPPMTIDDILGPWRALGWSHGSIAWWPPGLSGVMHGPHYFSVSGIVCCKISREWVFTTYEIFEMKLTARLHFKRDRGSRCVILWEKNV